MILNQRKDDGEINDVSICMHSSFETNFNDSEINQTEDDGEINQTEGDGEINDVETCVHSSSKTKFEKINEVIDKHSFNPFNKLCMITCYVIRNKDQLKTCEIQHDEKLYAKRLWFFGRTS